MSYQQQTQKQQQHRLVYAPQCTNCKRFLEALRRTSAAGSVSLIDINTLPPQYRARFEAVPTLVAGNGIVLVGTQAFMWLKQFEAEKELDCFAGGKGLPFSSVHDDSFALSYSSAYSAFEPVP